VGLLKLGYSISVMSEKGGYYSEKLEELGAHLIDYKPKSKLDIQAISLIKQTVRENKIDVVHAFNSKAISNACFALWNVDVKIVGYRGYTGNIHWFDPTTYLTFLNPRLDYMICLADSVRTMFLKNGMSSKKAITINKGHHPDWYSNIEIADLTEFSIPNGALTCAFVANNRTRMKGLHDLVEATNLLPEDANICILLIGKGMDTDEIKRLIENSSKPNRFIFTGFRNDSNSIVKACDIAISVSLFGEATQKAMIEAMYLSKPVIITNIPGNIGMVENGEGGYVINPSSPKEIASSINSFIANRENIPAMGKKAKEHIEQFLSNEKTIREYAQFYSSISEK
jgi:glycosyltransferase involved in cell wall biosynthesis